MSDIAALLSDYIGVAVLLIGGLWAYRKFLDERQGKPATDIDVDLEFVGIQSGEHVVQVTASLENRSLVRHRYKDFTVTIRYLTAEDDVADGDARVNYQLDCRRTIDSRIGEQKRYFANASYINPKQRFRHRYITYLSSNATFAWVQCRFTYDFTGIRSWWPRNRHAAPVGMNSPKIYRVPAPGAANCGHPCRCRRGVVI